MICRCGNNLGPTATSCPLCGRTFVLKSIATVIAWLLAILVVLFFYHIFFG